MAGDVARVDDQLTPSARQLRRPSSGRLSWSERIWGCREGRRLHHADFSGTRACGCGLVTSLSVKSPSAPAQTGVWVGIAAITMSFAAYSSALVVRQGASPDWQHFTLPRVLFFNTLVVLASSATLYVARPRSRATADGSGTVTAVDAPHLTWLYATILLGFLF